MWLKHLAQGLFFTGMTGTAVMIFLVNINVFFIFLGVLGAFLMVCYLVMNGG